MFQEYTTGDAWVAQLVKHLPSAQVHDPRVLESSPASGSLLSGEPASPSACRSPLLVLSLSLGKKNNNYELHITQLKINLQGRLGGSVG